MPSPHSRTPASESGVPATGPRGAGAAGGVNGWCWPIVLLALLASKALLLVVARYAWGLEALAYRWDGIHFIGVASHGYASLEDAAFAPLYPLLIRLLASRGLPYWEAALLAGNLASLALAPALCALYTRRGALAAALFPTLLLYTTAPYSASVALPLAAGGLALASWGMWGWASLLMGLAGLARYQLALLSLVLALAAARRSWRGAAYMLAAALAPGAAAALIGLHYYGDPLIYLRAEALWGAGLGIPFYSQVEWLLHSWFTRQAWTLGPIALKPWMWAARNLGFYAVYIAGLPLLYRQGRTLELAWSAAVILLVASLTGVPAASAPRLLLPAFPAIAALGERWRPGLGYAGASLVLTLFFLAWHMNSFLA